MSCETLATEIQYRIHQLKSEQVQLRTFIESDQAKWDALDKAIQELNWVLELVEKNKNSK